MSTPRGDNGSSHSERLLLRQSSFIIGIFRQTEPEDLRAQAPVSGVAGWFARGVGCHAPGVGVTDGAVMDTAALQSGRSALMGLGGRGG